MRVIFNILLLLSLLMGPVARPETELRQINASWHPEDPHGYRVGITEGDCVVQTAPEVVYRVLLNESEEWDQFVPTVLDSRIISREEANKIVQSKPDSWNEVLALLSNDKRPLEERMTRQGFEKITLYRLSYLDLPWPVKNRWVLTREIDTMNRSRHTFKRQYKRIAGSVVRSDGEWLILPDQNNPGWSRLSYTNTADAGFGFPHFIGKPASKKVVRGILKAIRDKAESLK